MKASLYFVLLLLPLLYFSGQLAYGQRPAPELKYSHSFPVSSPTAISQDRHGNIYLLDSKRNLVRLDSLGYTITTYSPPTRGRISSIEAWNPMKLFLFYEDRQELLLLDRFLRPISSTQLANFENNGVIKAATIASDDGFWLFNQSDFTLAKLDLRLRQFTIETPLNLILDQERFDVRFLREYQNMLYILDANGIYVFDNLGNYKKKLSFTNLSYIGFSGNELYFVDGPTLRFVDLYTSASRVMNLPEDKVYISALVGGNYLYLFGEDQMDVYTLQ